MFTNPNARPHTRGRSNEQFFLDELSDLLKRANTWGVVLSIDAVPRAPLAMGSYDLVGGARPARDRSTQ